MIFRTFASLLALAFSCWFSLAHAQSPSRDDFHDSLDEAFQLVIDGQFQSARSKLQLLRLTTRRNPPEMREDQAKMIALALAVTVARQGSWREALDFLNQGFPDIENETSAYKLTAEFLRLIIQLAQSKESSSAALVKVQSSLDAFRTQNPAWQNVSSDITDWLKSQVPVVEISDNKATHETPPPRPAPAVRLGKAGKSGAQKGSVNELNTSNAVGTSNLDADMDRFRRPQIRLVADTQACSAHAEVNYWNINASQVNLRPGPNTNNTPLKTLRLGTLVTSKIGGRTQGGWVEVNIPDSAGGPSSGWVSSEFLQASVQAKEQRNLFVQNTRIRMRVGPGARFADVQHGFISRNDRVLLLGDVADEAGINWQLVCAVTDRDGPAGPDDAVGKRGWVEAVVLSDKRSNPVAEVVENQESCSSPTKATIKILKGLTLWLELPTAKGANLSATVIADTDFVVSPEASCGRIPLYHRFVRPGTGQTLFASSPLYLPHDEELETYQRPSEDGPSSGSISGGDQAYEMLVASKGSDGEWSHLRRIGGPPESWFWVKKRPGDASFSVTRPTKPVPKIGHDTATQQPELNDTRSAKTSDARSSGGITLDIKDLDYGTHCRDVLIGSGSGFPRQIIQMSDGVYLNVVHETDRKFDKRYDAPTSPGIDTEYTVYGACHINILSDYRKGRTVRRGFLVIEEGSDGDGERYMLPRNLISKFDFLKERNMD